MRYVVCYDIADDRRRDRVAKLLLDFGARIQESVFTATLDRELYGRMKERLGRAVNEGADRVHIFALCAGCEEKVTTLGQAEVPKVEDYYVL